MENQMATQIKKNEYFSYYASATNEERKEFKNWLKGVMQTEIVNLTFRKTDGTLRNMKCTLLPKFLPEVVVSDKPKRKVSEDTLAVFDLEKNEWRSFRYDSVTEIKFTLGNKD
jgi:hypothetical protein